MTMTKEDEKTEIDQLVDEDVVQWKIEQMVKAGIPEYKAIAMACSKIDYHKALDLVRRGCPPGLVSGILL